MAEFAGILFALAAVVLMFVTFPAFVIWMLRPEGPAKRVMRRSFTIALVLVVGVFVLGFIDGAREIG